tara:strand:- start:8078 stop:10222 length:2145 start_codon:yes stop_codon:yes gene_type:complete
MEFRTTPVRPSGIYRWLWPIAIILLFVLAGYNLTQYYHTRNESIALTKERISANVIAEAREFQRFTSGIEKAAQRLAQAIGNKSLPRESYQQALLSLVESNEMYYGGTIAFAPYEYEPDRRLYAPYYAKKDGGLTFLQIEDNYDYSLPEYTWFGKAMELGSRWSEPYFDDSVGDILMTTYSAVIYDRTEPGSRRPVGVVTVDIGISDIGHIVKALHYGSSGLVEVVTADGTYLYSPNKSRVLRKASILDKSRWPDPQDLNRLRQQLASDQPGVVELDSTGVDSVALLSIAPLESTGWRIVDTFNQSEIVPRTVAMREQLMRAIAFVVVALIGVLFFGNFFEPKEGVFAWPTVFLMTIVLAAGIYTVWQVANTYDSSRHRQPSEISSERQSLAIQREVVEHSLEHSTLPPIFIPTGVYIESLKFTSPNDTLIIGSVWQRFDIEQHASVNRGVLFPGAETVRMSAPSVVRSGNTEVVRWNFQGSLRLALDYRRFPLILDSISLGIKPVDAVGNAMLVPDLGAYPQLAPSTLPGIGPDTYLAGWRLERSFFELREWRQRTTFGLNDNFQVENFPEYYWTVEIEKVFIHAFISFLTPLIIAFVMVFILLLLSTRDKEKLDLMRTGIGFDIGVSASIFFVVVLSHISLRQKIISVEIFYLEYFYLLMYSNLLWVCFHSILNTTHPALVHRLTMGVTAKKAYFPVSFAIMFAFTWLAFYA